MNDPAQTPRKLIMVSREDPRDPAIYLGMYDVVIIPYGADSAEVLFYKDTEVALHIGSDYCYELYENAQVARIRTKGISAELVRATLLRAGFKAEYVDTRD